MNDEEVHRAAIADVLIERMPGKARHHLVEPLPGTGKIDTREEGRVL